MTGQLPRFVTAATLARVGDAGAGIGVVLLAVTRLGERGALVGGLLAATLTVPHAAGPWMGRIVDRATDPRRPLAAGCGVYAVALATATLLLDRGWPWAAGAGLVVAGLCGPLLTGGLSSLVAGLDVGGAGAEGRAYAVDAVTYGVTGTAGPAAVAALAAAFSPAVALWAVAASVLLAAGLVVTLPVPPRTGASQPSAVGGAGTLLFRVRPLRRVTLTTMAAAATGGALTVAAVLLAVRFTGGSAGGAWLVSAVGVGTLFGSFAVLWRPLHGDAVRWSIGLSAVLGVGYLLVGIAPTYLVAVVVCAAIGLVTAPWVIATLAARDAHAPEGRRAQVFTAVAGWKLTAASAGTALAGVAAGSGPRPILVVGAALTLATAAVAALDRSQGRSHDRGHAAVDEQDLAVDVVRGG